MFAVTAVLAIPMMQVVKEPDGRAAILWHIGGCVGQRKKWVEWNGAVTGVNPVTSIMSRFAPERARSHVGRLSRSLG
jgi:hypothetical protein